MKEQIISIAPILLAFMLGYFISEIGKISKKAKRNSNSIDLEFTCDTEAVSEKIKSLSKEIYIASQQMEKLNTQCAPDSIQAKINKLKELKEQYENSNKN